MREVSSSTWSAVLTVLLGFPTAAQQPAFAVASFSESAPIGTVVAYAGDLGAVPRNWLLCDGRILRTSEYGELARTIGSRWGGTAATDFRVPDLMGRFLRGLDSTAGRDPDVGDRLPAYNGGVSKNNVGSVQTDAFENHRHELTKSDIAGTNGTQDVEQGSDKLNADKNRGSIEVGEANSGRRSAETRPKNAYVYWIIRAR